MSQKPAHFNTRYAGQVIKWSGTDQPDAADPNYPHDISYIYNTEGFRNYSFDDRPCSIALGCSHTEGVGLPVQFTWPSVLSEMIGHTVWNLGVGGASNDDVYRIAQYWIPELKPQHVFLLTPPSTRYSMYHHNTWNTISVHDSHDAAYNFIYFEHDENSSMNTQRNLDAVNSVALANHCALYSLNSEHEFTMDGLARDQQHSGPNAHHEIALIFETLLDI